MTPLILPGWQNSGVAHWQSRWEVLHGYQRVEQHDWLRPRRGDWMAQLDAAVIAAPAGPVALVAHSLGCILVAAWAAHSQHTARVTAALLVAPGDTETEAFEAMLPSWSPIVRARLPFKSLLLVSHNDPYCSLAKAQQLAADWGAAFVDYGHCGHINAESGLGDWPEGHAMLQALLAKPDAPFAEK